MFLSLLDGGEKKTWSSRGKNPKKNKKKQKGFEVFWNFFFQG